MFRTPPPQREDADLRRLAEAWRVEAEPIDDGTRTTFRDDRSSLEVFHASDSLWWARDADVLPEPSDAVDFADTAEAEYKAFASTCHGPAFRYDLRVLAIVRPSWRPFPHEVRLAHRY